MHVRVCVCARVCVMTNVTSHSILLQKKQTTQQKASVEQTEPATSLSLQTLSSASVSHVTLYFLPITYKTCGTDATDEFPPPPLPLSPAGKLHAVSGRCVSGTKKLLASDQGGGPLTAQRHH